MPLNLSAAVGLFGVVAITSGVVYLSGDHGAGTSVKVSSPNDQASRNVEVPGEPVQPLVESTDLDDGRVRFGKMLFFDTRLSADGTIACASCHLPDHGGADRVALSKGLNGRSTVLNTPTVYDARLSIAQFWDGRAATLEAQIDYPLHNESELGTTWPAVVSRLERDKDYVTAARSLYGAPLSREVISSAIVEYERSLVSTGSRFDEYLRGRSDALTEREKTGYRLFKEYGCAACHQGAAVGGNMFQKIGLFGDYVTDRGLDTPADLGRFNATGREDDRYVFKVPSLRNVALTAPYFHDGSVETLEMAIGLMARYQLGRSISSGDISDIAMFLRTLTPFGARNETDAAIN